MQIIKFLQKNKLLVAAVIIVIGIITFYKLKETESFRNYNDKKRKRVSPQNTVTRNKNTIKAPLILNMSSLSLTPSSCGPKNLGSWKIESGNVYLTFMYNYSYEPVPPCGSVDNVVAVQLLLGKATEYPRGATFPINAIDLYKSNNTLAIDTSAIDGTNVYSFSFPVSMLKLTVPGWYVFEVQGVLVKQLDSGFTTEISNIGVVHGNFDNI